MWHAYDKIEVNEYFRVYLMIVFALSSSLYNLYIDVARKRCHSPRDAVFFFFFFFFFVNQLKFSKRHVSKQVAKPNKKVK
jgi:hypothetical protein